MPIFLLSLFRRFKTHAVVGVVRMALASIYVNYPSLLIGLRNVFTLKTGVFRTRLVIFPKIGYEAMVGFLLLYSLRKHRLNCRLLVTEFLLQVVDSMEK